MTPLAQALSSALLHFVWQGFAVGVLLGIVLILLRRSSSDARYSASCTALALLALAPVLTGFLAYQPATAAGEPLVPGFLHAGLETPVISSVASPITASSLKGLQDWILPLWVGGVFVLSLRLAWACGHAASLRRRGVAAGASTVSLVADLAERSGIRRGVQVLMSSIAEVPSVVGWIRPVLLLPASVVVGLTPQQLEAVIAHELAHIRRHDYLVNIVQTVVETLLFYHPVVWWVSSRIRFERELCCDDFAVRACGDSVCYARALARLEKLRSLTPSLAIGSAAGPLFHRIQRLIGGGRPEQGPSRVALAVALIVGVLSVGLNMSVAGVQREVRGAEQVPAIAPWPAVVLQAPPVAPQSPKEVLPQLPPRQTAPASPTPGPEQAVPPAATLEITTPEIETVLTPGRYTVGGGISGVGASFLGATFEDAHWVLFLGNNVIVHGSSADEAAAKAVHQSLGGDLLWFLLDGKAYVSQDSATIARVHEADLLKESQLALQNSIFGEQRKVREALVGLMEMQQLAEKLRAMTDTPVPTQQALTDLSRRLNLLQAEINNMRAQVTQRQALENYLRVVDRQRDRQVQDILREAITSGKARVAQ